MRRLPPLLAAMNLPALPMAEGSAAALVRMLLRSGDSSETERPNRIDTLVEILSADPPLVLWVACVAWQQEAFRPDTIEDVARWLDEHLVGVMRWESEAAFGLGGDGLPDEKAQADRSALSLQVADLAAHLARQMDSISPAAAFLEGLLHNADDWLVADDHRLFPGQTDNAAVQLALEILADRAPQPDSVEFDIDACLARAKDGRRRWLAPDRELADLLPTLTEKLARLAELDQHFDEVLQREKLEAMAEFAAGAGHEINNPLTVIAGRAQLFLREEKDPQRRRALALMDAQAKRVYEMIADMMLFARPPQPEIEEVDLIDLVDRVIREMAPRANGQETSLRRTGTNEPVFCEVDPTQLTVALKAMCQNALEAIGRHGCVDLAVDGSDRQVRITVADDGPGISAEERRHLFDPYYSARQAGRGLGLGLSKAWRIVTNHGGTIHVESQPDHGSLFTVTLPRRSGDRA